MKFLPKTTKSLIHSFILFGFLALLAACDSGSDNPPDAQVPRITSISADVSTVLNIAKEISVGVEVSDFGQLSYQWYVSDSKLSLGTPEENANATSFTPKTEKTGTFYYYCVIANRLGSSIRTAISPVVTYKVADCINAQIPSVVRQPENVTANFGENFSLSTFAYPTDGGTLSYQWFFTADKDKDATPITGATKATCAGLVSANTLGYYYCVVTNTISDNGDGGEKTAETKTEAARLSSTQVFAREPVILQQPQNLTQDFGNAFTFSVTAYSADEGLLSYQWYFKATEQDEATILAGATKATYAGTVSKETIGSYRCVVTNTISNNGDGGTKSASVNTDSAALTVVPICAKAPIVAQQPKNVKADFGSEFTLSTVAYPADGGTLSYQWYFSVTETENMAAIIGATKSEYTGTIGTSTIGYYYCVVTNTISDNGDGGEKTASTKTESVAISSTQVGAKVPLILQQPQNERQDFGKNFTFTVTAYSTDGGTLSYQWYYKAGKEDEAVAVEGAAKATCTGTVSAKTIGYYYCVITNTISDNGDGGTKTATIQTNTVNLSNDKIEANEPVILTQPQGAALHVPEKATLSVSAYSADKGTLSYQWHRISEDTDTVIEGATKSSYEAVAESVGAIQYYCVVTNTISDNGDGGSKSASTKSNAVTVTVTSVSAQKPAIVRQPEKLTAIFGTAFSLSTVAYSVDGGTLSYQWYHSAEADKAATALSGATAASYSGTVGSGTLGYYYCVVTNAISNNGDGGSKSADIKTETVQIVSTQVKATTPVILQQPQNVKQNFGNAFTFTVTAYSPDEGTLSYQWYHKATEQGETVAVDGANGSAFTGTVGADTVGNYYCVVTNTISDNGDGGTKVATVQTDAVTLSNNLVNAVVPGIFTRLEDVKLHVPEKTTFIVAAYSTDGGTLSYQWHKVTDDTDAAIEGATNASCEVVATEVGTAKYYCVVTNTISDNGDGGSKSADAKTNVATVNVVYVSAGTPIITVQPDDVSAVIPAIKVFNVGAYTEDDGELTYQWYSVAEGDSEGTAITGETKSKLIVTVRELGKTGYYCIVTNTIADNGDGSGAKTASVQTQTAWLDAVYLKNVISAPAFTVQPPKMNVAPYNQSIKISCTAEAAEGAVSYRWYQSTDGTTATGIAVSNATTATLSTPKYTERGIYYYYCVATTVLTESDESVKSACAMSDVVSVAYTGLPVVYVNTPNSVAITSKEVWTENATISLTGAKDASWNFDEVATSIRGRGNSTWNQPKKPYALKLGKKQKVMGMPKHKRWVLIANYLDNSFMRNEMAFYLSETFELDYTVRGKFVDFVLNGDYKGLYWLGEAIKPDENRVNINDGSETMTDDEDKDYLIEMDVYYDEAVKFKSSIRNMPYMIKNDDYMIDDNNELTTGGQARLERLQTKITNLEELLYPDFTAGMDTNKCAAPDESYAEVIDIDSWAKFWFVNEIMDNGELSHPKSCYFTFDSTNDIFKAGPVWDFDWAALQQNGCWIRNTIYYNALFKSPSFRNRTKELWSEYYRTIDIESRIEAMRSEIYVSQQCDTMIWGEHKDPSGIVRANFDAYVDFLKETLLKKLNVVNTTINGL